MNGKVFIGDCKFWVDDQVIHCRLSNEFDKKSLESNVFVLIETIDVISNGKYLPILFDFQNLRLTQAIAAYKHLSQSTQLEKIVLSKTFLVSSLYTKFFLTCYAYFKNPLNPDNVFFSSKIAMGECLKMSKVFNAVN